METTREVLTELISTVSSTAIVLIGFIFVTLYVFYQSAPEIFDIYIDISNSDYELFDSNVSLFERFTWYESLLVILSIYYQYTVITPETGLQSVVSEITGIVLFAVFINFVIKNYFIDLENN